MTALPLRVLAVALAAPLLLSAPARADEAARKKLQEKLHPAAAQADDAPVPAPPLEPAEKAEAPPARTAADLSGNLPTRPRAEPAAAELPQRPARAASPRGARRQAAAEQPLGLALNLSLAGGGTAGTGSRYANSRIAEVELAVGYELLDGLVRPELGLLVGTYPNTYVGLRPGLRAFLPATPIYGRAALDLADPSSVMRARWVLLGAGAELRLTDLVGLFGEVDVGAPLRHQMGFPALLRGGLSARF
ncbi:hypothetical protein [Anaeromyxobacter paludicola]|uniref:Outer membrane protein beta-barrel domain-containing protein n=1 Tax=Anaeromyxobacter paludicola TaxID=2918171 RepID=A0ABN6NAJ8_9BACT|nr:hypothetical protein [Anaeromyxobacter paludicola]BDG09370.1 hypothetical protein AMPC_24830 [Anaeromyxobacter paludicola]